MTTTTTMTSKTPSTKTSLFLRLQQGALLGVPSCDQPPKTLLPLHLVQPGGLSLPQVLDVLQASMLLLSLSLLRDALSGLPSQASLHNLSTVTKAQIRHSPRTIPSRAEALRQLHTANAARVEIEDEPPLDRRPTEREERAEMLDAGPTVSIARKRTLLRYQEHPSLE